MSVVPLMRVALYGELARKMKVLEDLQEMGCLHLIGGKEGRTPAAPLAISVQTHEAYLYLKNCPEKRRQVRRPDHFDPEAVEKEALQIRDATLRLNDERDYLIPHLQALEPWEEFEMPPLEQMGGLRMWFFIVPLREMDKVRSSGLIWHCVAQGHMQAYVVVLAEEEPKEMPVPRIHTGSRSLTWLRERLVEVEGELEDLYWRRVGLTRWCALFARILHQADDRAALQQAASGTVEEGHIFVLQAWAPKAALGQVKAYAEQQGLALVVESPGRDETPPTLLQNPSQFQAGEALVQFYTVPGYNRWDPSKAVLFSFLAFFAMILSDAGYGLLCAMMALLFWRRLTQAGRPVVSFTLLVVSASIGYGILVGSYFGHAPAQGSVLALLQVLDVYDQNQMIAVSVAVGVGHLLLAHGMNLVQGVGGPSRMASLGWMLLLIGGALWGGGRSGLWPLWGGDGLHWTLLAGGAFLVLGFSGSRSWRNASWKERGMRMLDGVVALTGMSRAFGDVLSYLRLFALGLASAQLAMTFNLIAADVGQQVPGVGPLLAIVVLLLGHGLNFLLAMAGGVVHGLRLNYIEFFNWGLTEEGYPFRPFSKRETAEWNRS